MRFVTEFVPDSGGCVAGGLDARGCRCKSSFLQETEARSEEGGFGPTLTRGSSCSLHSYCPPDNRTTPPSFLGLGMFMMFFSCDANNVRGEGSVRNIVHP